MTKLYAVCAVALALQAAPAPAGRFEEATCDSKVYGTSTATGPANSATDS